MSAAKAPPEDAVTTQARLHFERGRIRFEEGRYAQAIAEFEEGYRLRPLPRFLYNIAQSYRHLGQREQAIRWYERYLEAAPDATDRAEVEGYLAQLRADGSAQRRLEYRESPQPPFVPHPTERAQASAPAESTRSSTGHHRWIWYAAAAATVVAGGIVTVLAVRSSHDPPATDLGNLRIMAP